MAGKDKGRKEVKKPKKDAKKQTLAKVTFDEPVTVQQVPTRKRTVEEDS